MTEIFPFKENYDKRLKTLSEGHECVGYRPDPPAYNVILKASFFYLIIIQILILTFNI